MSATKTGGSIVTITAALARNAVFCSVFMVVLPQIPSS
jgi:hypothetical protein